MLTKVTLELDGMQLESIRHATNTALNQMQATIADIQRQVKEQIDAHEADLAKAQTKAGVTHVDTRKQA